MKLIDGNKLILRLKELEKFNNTDIPEWVFNVIRGMPEKEQSVYRPYKNNNPKEEKDVH